MEIGFGKMLNENLIKQMKDYAELNNVLVKLFGKKLPKVVSDTKSNYSVENRKQTIRKTSLCKNLFGIYFCSLFAIILRVTFSGLFGLYASITS